MFALKIISTGSQAGNSYLVSDGNEGLLLDCGCRPKDLLPGIDFAPSKVSGCLITHEHGDHTRSVKKVMELGIPCYACDQTHDFIQTVYGEKVIAVPEKKWQAAGNFKFFGFYVPHDGTYNMGWLIELPNESRMIYVTDFEFLPITFKSWNINFWLMECNHCDDLVDRQEAKYEHSLRGHSSLKTVKGIITANKTPAMRNTVLCHLSEGWSDPVKMKSEIQQVAGSTVTVDIAAAGATIPLKLYPWEK